MRSTRFWEVLGGVPLLRVPPLWREFWKESSWVCTFYMVFPQEIMYKVKIWSGKWYCRESAQQLHRIGAATWCTCGCMCKASAPCQNVHIFTFLVMTKATLIILERFLKLKNWTETRCYEISLQYNVPQNGDLPAIRHSNSWIIRHQPLPHVLERVALECRSVLSSLSMSGPKISKVLLEK